MARDVAKDVQRTGAAQRIRDVVAKDVPEQRKDVPEQRNVSEMLLRKMCARCEWCRFNRLETVVYR